MRLGHMGNNELVNRKSGSVSVSMLSWNVAQVGRWDAINRYDLDVVLLQEAPRPPANLDYDVYPKDLETWETAGYKRRSRRTAIAAPSGRLTLKPIETADIYTESAESLLASRPGTLTAADVYRGERLLFTVVSLYGAWESALRDSSKEIYADASVHRLLSDLSPVLTGRRNDIPVIMAGDLNILLGYGESGNQYWAARYQSVFSRIESMGLKFVGPQSPHGRQANPWPAELPADSLNVPTFHSNRRSPMTAERQLDYVFATTSTAKDVRVEALNHSAEIWGESDHCQIRIEVTM
jgi:hypothetical protein